MFCYQCEQTKNGTGCVLMGICGKDDTTATLQDLLVHVAEGVSILATQLGKETDRAVYDYVLEALFTTVTNVNFDPERVAGEIRRGGKLIADLKAAAEAEGKTLPNRCPKSQLPDDIDSMLALGRELSIEKRREEFGPVVAGLQELVLYGLKGAAAYAQHAAVLGCFDEALATDFVAKLKLLAGNPTDPNVLLAAALDVGRINLRAMQILNDNHVQRFGKPEPTAVRITPKAGHCILISGHDLEDLYLLLQQTEGKGINIYTHGEMLPALAYPELKKFPHLVGNYGGAWQDQQREFDEFPGAILMTTNCIQKPRPTYKDRIFTAGLVAWPDVTHIGPEKDFTPVIEAALAAPGFAADEPEKTILTGFAADAVLGVADKVIDAVKAGAIRHFFLIGGCDGAKPGRNYFTDLALKTPQDCVILTLACGKYRFNKEDFGTIGGLPRLLDIGQCNDAYSAIRIAVALAEAFNCGVNDLPLSLVLSWYEQKAVAILLTLLHLGIKNIRLGPTLPAFVAPEALQILVEKFNIAPTTTPEADLEAILGPVA